MVVRAARLPAPGETVPGGTFAMMPGGKGANQAVAATRLGADVTFVARIGADIFGDKALSGFEAEGIDTRYTVRDPDIPSGVALIGVDEASGENSIIVASGANASLSIMDVWHAAGAIAQADVLICQLESPLDTVAFALRSAHEAGVRTILNPAPARPLSDDLLRNVTVLTPNESEAALLAGKEGTTTQLAHALRAAGAENVVMTLGGRGAIVVTEYAATLERSFTPPRTVDTTAAGDCFTGALGVGMAEGMTITQAARFANAAAALSVSKAGAQPSLPSRQAVDRLLID